MGDAPLVTLLTDFGTRDSYVAEMKGAMLAIAPDLRFLDITHDVRPGDLPAARYLLARSWHRFPAGTVHLAVVDPGVGTARRALAGERNGHRFVGPDNGLLAPVLGGADCVSLPVPEGASPTFHGRDVFAPAAARLAAGEPLRALGESCTDWTGEPMPTARREGDGWRGEVIYVDHFGTLVTNLPGSAVGTGDLMIGGTAVPWGRTFADVGAGELVAFVGSDGTVEIAERDGSAAAALGAGVGTGVRTG